MITNGFLLGEGCEDDLLCSYLKKTNICANKPFFASLCAGKIAFVNTIQAGMFNEQKTGIEKCSKGWFVVDHTS